MPKQASKADAVVRHMRARGYAPEECIAVGDSREDLGVAAVVGRFFLVANAVEKDPGRDARRPGQRGGHRGAQRRGLLRGRDQVVGGTSALID